MSSATALINTRDIPGAASLSLYATLNNSLILRSVVPYLPPSGVTALAATNRSFNQLIFKTPGVFRYLNLTSVKSAQFDIDNIDHGGQTWRNVQLDENLTEDE